MTEPLTRPVSEVRDGLTRSGTVEQPAQVMGPDDAEHFHVDDMGRDMVGVIRQPFAEKTVSAMNDRPASIKAVRVSAAMPAAA